jgi:hypothetical protein
MKIEDCKVGMKVERFWENHNNVRKNSIYTVKALREEDVKLEETNDEYWYDLNLFRPVSKNPKPANKFEVGDKAIYQLVKGGGHKVEIFGRTTKNDKYIYAIKGQFKNVNEKFVLIAKEKELLQLKKKDELKVGDKVVYGTAKYKILCVGIDDYYKHKEYYCKRIDENFKGVTTIIKPNAIDEIIYE